MADIFSPSPFAVGVALFYIVNILALVALFPPGSDEQRKLAGHPVARHYGLIVVLPLLLHVTAPLWLAAQFNPRVRQVRKERLALRVMRLKLRLGILWLKLRYPEETRRAEALYAARRAREQGQDHGL